MKSPGTKREVSDSRASDGRGVRFFFFFSSPRCMIDGNIASGIHLSLHPLVEMVGCITHAVKSSFLLDAAAVQLLFRFSPDVI
jgi:hypothetical protein